MEHPTRGGWCRPGALVIVAAGSPFDGNLAGIGCDDKIVLTFLSIRAGQVIA